MLRWEAINPVIVSLVSDILRKPEAPADWEAEWLERRDANRMISPEQGGALYLKVTSCVPVGIDMTRYEMQADAGGNIDLHEVLVGYRRFTLQVQAWESEHTDLHWAIRTLEKLRTRLFRTSSLQRLLAVNVDLTDDLASRKMTQTIGGRRWSIATMDLLMTGAFDAADESPTGWIERIRLTSHIEDAEIELPFPPNTRDELIPNYVEKPDTVGAMAGSAAGTSTATGTLEAL